MQYLNVLSDQSSNTSSNGTSSDTLVKLKSFKILLIYPTESFLEAEDLRI